MEKGRDLQRRYKFWTLRKPQPPEMKADRKCTQLLMRQWNWCLPGTTMSKLPLQALDTQTLLFCALSHAYQRDIADFFILHLRTLGSVIWNWVRAGEHQTHRRAPLTGFGHYMVSWPATSHFTVTQRPPNLFWFLSRNTWCNLFKPDDSSMLDPAAILDESSRNKGGGCLTLKPGDKISSWDSYET